MSESGSALLRQGCWTDALNCGVILNPGRGENAYDKSAT
jgi:hypothetical protein